jgi:ethanolamine ammonia-lyase small subunit
MGDEGRVERVGDDPWPVLRGLTTARIGLGRAGVSLPTRRQLAFQLAHAQARDAVHSALDLAQLQRELAARGRDALVLRSAAGDRTTYLQRPDLGRRLDEDSARRLSAQSEHAPDGYDVAFVIADGLSALAIERHALPMLAAVLPELEHDGWSIAPLTLVEHGRVAISDEIGALLGTRQVVILIGERPGLSAPDSLGIYLTHGPRIGNTDAARNCISNIRDAGLSYAAAARTLLYLMHEARSIGRSGVELKDRAEPAPLDASDLPRLSRNFLVDED